MKASEQMRVIGRQIEEIEPLITMQTQCIPSLHQVEWYLMQALREVKSMGTNTGKQGSHKND